MRQVFVSDDRLVVEVSRGCFDVQLECLHGSYEERLTENWEIVGWQNQRKPLDTAALARLNARWAGGANGSADVAGGGDIPF